MIELFKKIFGSMSGTDYEDLIKKGAQIIDVRTRGEFQGGHIRGSINIPLQELQKNLSKINKNKPVITCCASGMRSASAKNILKTNGFNEVYNGGGWMALQRRTSRENG